MRVFLNFISKITVSSRIMSSSLVRLLFAIVFVILAVDCVRHQTSHGRQQNPRNNQNSTSSYNNTLVVGFKRQSDILLEQKRISEPAKRNRALNFEKNFRVGPRHSITLVVAEDQSTNGTASEAKIVKGGPGSNNVTLKFTSQKGRGVDFLVTLYGKRN